MNQQRLEQLLRFLQETPEDPFLLYAIATEYIDEAPEKALQYFDRLSHDHPNYVPTYYHLAHLYIEMNDLPMAKNVFEKGISIAQQQGDQHALSELQNAYQNFLFEYD